MLMKEPFLCAWGIAPPYICMRMEDFNFDASRQDLSNRLNEFKICCEWLRNQKQRKTINHAIGTSYSLKHVVERWAGEYVSNGSFIAALIHLGINYEVENGGPNVWVSLSNHCLKGK